MGVCAYVCMPLSLMLTFDYKNLYANKNSKSQLGTTKEFNQNKWHKLFQMPLGCKSLVRRKCNLKFRHFLLSIFFLLLLHCGVRYSVVQFKINNEAQSINFQCNRFSKKLSLHFHFIEDLIENDFECPHFLLFFSGKETQYLDTFLKYIRHAYRLQLETEINTSH